MKRWPWRWRNGSGVRPTITSTRLFSSAPCPPTIQATTVSPTSPTTLTGLYINLASSTCPSFPSFVAKSSLYIASFICFPINFAFAARDRPFGVKNFHPLSETSESTMIDTLIRVGWSFVRVVTHYSVWWYNYGKHNNNLIHEEVLGQLGFIHRARQCQSMRQCPNHRSPLSSSQA